MKPTILIILGILVSCSTKDSKRKINDKSIELNNRGIEYYHKWVTNSPGTKMFADSSLFLLGESIKLDSLNRAAYWNKLAFEQGLGYYDRAKETARLFYKQFNEPFALLSLGTIYKKLDDSIESKKYFSEALNYYSRKIKSGDISEDSVLYYLTLAAYFNNDLKSSREYYERFRNTKQGQLTYRDVDFDSLKELFKQSESNAR